MQVAEIVELALEQLIDTTQLCILLTYDVFMIIAIMAILRD